MSEPASAGALQAFAQVMAAIASAQIQLEAMKVANEQRRRNDMADAYGSDEFFTLQQNLDGLVREQVGWIR